MNYSRKDGATVQMSAEAHDGLKAVAVGAFGPEEGAKRLEHAMETAQINSLGSHSAQVGAQLGSDIRQLSGTRITEAQLTAGQISSKAAALPNLV